MVSLLSFKILFKHIYSSRNLSVFREVVLQHEWGYLKHISDPNKMFDLFLEDFLSIHSPSFPIKMVHQHMLLSNLSLQLKNSKFQLQEDFPQSNFSHLIQEQNDLYIQQVNTEKTESNYSKIRYSRNTKNKPNPTQK